MRSRFCRKPRDDPIVVGIKSLTRTVGPPAKERIGTEAIRSVKRQEEIVISTKDDMPLRVAKRPDPAQWSDAELMSLYEAAALFWPDGPLTVTSLRTAVRDGKLGVAEIAGKLLTTKAAIAEMSSCTLRQRAPTAEIARPEGDDHAPSGPLARIRERRLRRKLARGG